ncbi:hypothetical protein [Flammeovirga aprica]|uniref:Uncharacterized protein n=1 Tax=Flammeovirga aprica JL-4 TaxID=694437 RepID=A0A7X9P441_9BACT|nr:hypothetical protein [Flammeovirga aprica]NME68624.1 hypothetical protein [Flammeovirga aprica JL-4]
MMSKKFLYIANTSIAFITCMITFLLMSEKEKEKCCNIKENTPKIEIIKEIRKISTQGNQTQCCLPEDRQPLANTVISIHSPFSPLFLSAFDNDTTTVIASQKKLQKEKKDEKKVKDYRVAFLSKRFSHYIIWLCRLLL